MSHDIAGLTRQWFDRVWNQKDDGAVEQLMWPDVRNYGVSDDGQPLNRDQLLAFRESFLEAFPDLQVTIHDVLQDGDAVVMRLSFTGTHTGPGIRIPPTGRRFFSTAIVIYRWRDGKLYETWNEFDAAGMLRQLQDHTAWLRL